MYRLPYMYPGAYVNAQMPYLRQQPIYWSYPQMPMPENIEFKDQGKQLFVIDIEEAAERNQTFRTAIWTGNHLQVTLMSIGVGEDIGLEIHPHTDQLLQIVEGDGVVQMGATQNNLDFQRRVSEDSAIFVPAGTWHNLINTGHRPLKLYSIYAPPEHPSGTIHQTKADDKHH